MGKKKVFHEIKVKNRNKMVGMGMKRGTTGMRMLKTMRKSVGL